MELSNAIVSVSPMRLDIQLARIHARIGHSAIIRIVRVPDDIQRLFLRVFKADHTYFDIPANEHKTPGVWTARVIGTCFPETGEVKYEVHAEDAEGNSTALGEGIVAIAAFSTTTSPVAVGSPVTVAQVPTPSGSMVQVQMVQDENGQWVFQAVTE